MLNMAAALKTVQASFCVRNVRGHLPNLQAVCAGAGETGLRPGLGELEPWASRQVSRQEWPLRELGAGL